MDRLDSIHTNHTVSTFLSLSFCEKYMDCFLSTKFGQMSAFLKLQIICDNLKQGEIHDNKEEDKNFT